ncbi:probable purine permease 11 isoform X1 [Tanacetum coccineum]
MKVQAASPKRNLCRIHASWQGARVQWKFQFPLHSCSLAESTSAMNVSNWGGHLHFHKVGEFFHMADAGQEIELQTRAAKDAISNGASNSTNTVEIPKTKRYRWWLRVSVYIIFLLAGQATATLLGGLYYDKGGNSKWMATFVQSAGFPILIPVLLFVPPSIKATSAPPVSTVLLLYLFFGFNAKGDNLITLALPIVPVLAVIFFGDKMNGVKAIALLLAIWGSASYVYQHYLDDRKLKAKARSLVNGDSSDNV